MLREHGVLAAGDPGNAPALVLPADELQLTSRELGAGGTGRVVLGHYRGREVAVKLLQLSGPPAAREALQREVRLLARVSSVCRHTVRLLGVTVKDGRLALVMPKYPCSLTEYMGQLPGGCVPSGRVALIAVDLLRGLAELHAHGIVMADLKPDNVLLDEAGTPLLCDFGIGRAIVSTVGQHVLTSPQGSLNYMAPEQFAMGEGDAVTPQSDMWALAATLLHALTGRPPWPGLNMGQITMQVGVHRRPPELPPDLHPALRSLLGRCLTPDPKQRPSAAVALAAMERDVAARLQNSYAPVAAVPAVPGPAAAPPPELAAPLQPVPVQPPAAAGSAGPGARAPAPSTSPSAAPPPRAPQRAVPLTSLAGLRAAPPASPAAPPAFFAAAPATVQPRPLARPVALPAAPPTGPPTGPPAAAHPIGPGRAGPGNASPAADEADWPSLNSLSLGKGRVQEQARPAAAPAAPAVAPPAAASVAAAPAAAAPAAAAAVRQRLPLHLHLVDEARMLVHSPAAVVLPLPLVPDESAQRGGGSGRVVARLQLGVLLAATARLLVPRVRRRYLLQGRGCSAGFQDVTDAELMTGLLLESDMHQDTEEVGPRVMVVVDTHVSKPRVEVVLHNLTSTVRIMNVAVDYAWSGADLGECAARALPPNLAPTFHGPYKLLDERGWRKDVPALLGSGLAYDGGVCHVGGLERADITVNVRTVQQPSTTLFNKCLAVPVHASWAVDDLKWALQGMEGIPQGRQCLIWENKQLSDGRFLGDCGIGDGSVVILVLRNS